MVTKAKPCTLAIWLLLTYLLLYARRVHSARGLSERQVTLTRGYYTNLCTGPSPDLCAASSPSIGEFASADIIERVVQICKVCGHVFGDEAHYCCLCNELIFDYCISSLPYFPPIEED